MSKLWIKPLGGMVCLLLLTAGCTQQDADLAESADSAEQAESTESKAQPSSDDSELTPEQVLARMDEAEGVGVEQGPVEVRIVSPTEATFKQGQARFWHAEVSELVNGASCSCDWKFYLNEYDEETLYHQMDDRQCTATETAGTLSCGFTSTAIDSRGDLRTVVDVEVKKGGEVVQTASDEETYKVL